MAGHDWQEDHLLEDEEAFEDQFSESATFDASQQQHRGSTSSSSSALAAGHGHASPPTGLETSGRCPSHEFVRAHVENGGNGSLRNFTGIL